MKKIITSIVSILFLILIINNVIAPENNTVTPNCKYLYWFDNTHNTECGYKMYCGAYMYLGLETFETKDECIKRLNEVFPVSCIDSDQGKNYYVKGKTSDNSDTIILDRCMADSSNTLIEGYCENNVKKSITYTCPNGCQDGACFKEFGGCVDSDGGINYYVIGYGAPHSNLSGGAGGGWADRCLDSSTLVEYYCDSTIEQGWNSKNFICPNGCQDGACIKEENNTLIKCNSDSDCPKCECARDGITPCKCDSYKCVNGICQALNNTEQVIKEQITCFFSNSNEEQECYLAGQWGPEDIGTKYCKGKESCTISYTDNKEDKITWKSTCGGYQYTKQDGFDEKILFDCNEGETNITQILNKGFRYAYYQCYDGTEEKAGSETSCKLSETWKKYAEEFCKDHCAKDGKCGVTEDLIDSDKCLGKCGVNSFSVFQDCYTDELPVPGFCIGEDIQNCCNKWAIENNIITPECIGGWIIENDKCIYSCKDQETEYEILLCKDSCPFDNKCYPFGYRKEGKYCSDNNGFISQLKSSEKCENNFECDSNVCVSGECVSEGLIKKIIDWFSKVFGGKE